MSDHTLVVLSVVVVVAPFAVALGAVFWQHERILYDRAQHRTSGETIDFTRKRLGE